MGPSCIFYRVTSGRESLVPIQLEGWYVGRLFGIATSLRQLSHIRKLNVYHAVKQQRGT